MEQAEQLKTGKIGVIATDTIYGVVGSALNSSTVNKIYDIKRRAPSKPFIILISSIDDLALFNIRPSELTLSKLNKYWPGPISIILECNDDNFEYLHRGTNTLAFRIPAKKELQEIIKISGPLVAPSANPEGKTPAIDIEMAKQYFGDKVDFYHEGEINSKPSKIIKIIGDFEEIIRP
jgi:L-threonylcarbamoyladenylate synthase